MTFPNGRSRGGFMRPIGLGEFIRRFLAGELEGPVLDPDSRLISGYARVSRMEGAPQQDIWARYKDFLFVAWGQDLVERWQREGRAIPERGALRDDLERIARARIPQRRASMRLSSFYRYFRNLRALGWVEPTGQEEGSLFGGQPGARVELVKGGAVVEVPQPRRYYRLTPAGLAEPPDGEWRNPLLALYPERGPEYYRGSAQAARERRGRLPPRPPQQRPPTA